MHVKTGLLVTIWIAAALRPEEGSLHIDDTEAAQQAAPQAETQAAPHAATQAEPQAATQAAHVVAQVQETSRTVSVSPKGMSRVHIDIEIPMAPGGLGGTNSSSGTAEESDDDIHFKCDHDFLYPWLIRLVQHSIRTPGKVPDILKSMDVSELLGSLSLYPFINIQKKNLDVERLTIYFTQNDLRLAANQGFIEKIISRDEYRQCSGKLYQLYDLAKYTDGKGPLGPEPKPELFELAKSCKIGNGGFYALRYLAVKASLYQMNRNMERLQTKGAPNKSIGKDCHLDSYSCETVKKYGEASMAYVDKCIDLEAKRAGGD